MPKDQAWESNFLFLTNRPKNSFFHTFLDSGTRKAKVPNSLITKIRAKENDTNDILQTFR